MALGDFLAPDDARGISQRTTGVTTATPNAIPKLDSTGRVAAAQMPIGVAAPERDLPSSENFLAGAIVNVYNVAGTATVRNADATALAKCQNLGFVIAATLSGATAKVYFPGDEITGLSALTPGAAYFLDPTTPGAITATPPTTAGTFVVFVGFATSLTELIFEPDVRYGN